MGSDYAWIGWNPVEVWTGASLFDEGARRPVHPGWQPGDIRNCSYAAGPGWVGISAEDRTVGGYVVAAYDPHAGASRVLLRPEYVLHHALDRSGSRVCYTQPSAGSGEADLWLYTIDGGPPRCLIKNAVAQGSIPSWHPDGTQITYQSPDGRVMVLDSAGGGEEPVADGESPAFAPAGGSLAFRRDQSVWVWDGTTRHARPVGAGRPLSRRPLTDGLSWSPDGTAITFGAVAGALDKRTDFYLLNVADGGREKVRIPYLSGLILAPHPLV